jgi:hypothetical protein
MNSPRTGLRVASFFSVFLRLGILLRLINQAHSQRLTADDPDRRKLNHLIIAAILCLAVATGFAHLESESVESLNRKSDVTFWRFNESRQPFIASSLLIPLSRHIHV